MWLTHRAALPAGRALLPGLSSTAFRAFAIAAEPGSAGYEALVAKQIKEALNAEHCEVLDQSGGCGSSFAIRVVSEQFRGKSKVAQQRLVQGAIREEIAKWHAVTIRAELPQTE
eukprot:TRINITY_DN33689_c0_g1_i1.p1 TRINITY_DN33689_c0_g1~~TRINITY_DN33689_c0_g1_i1.p1  ORF type:complete len:114 (-),score=14.71 TRINITY_DN33689_c0_g1_i1:103-444(-)